MLKFSSEIDGTETHLSEGDGKTTSSQVPNEYNSGVSGQQGRGMVPQQPQSVETFGAGFEGLAKRSPFIEMLTSRIRQRQQEQQEKQSMEISPQMMRAFQDELGHIHMEKEAFIGKALTTVGKGLVGMAGKGAKGGLARRGAAGALGLARRAGFKGQRAYQAVGGAALGAGALGVGGAGLLAGRASR